MEKANNKNHDGGGSDNDLEEADAAVANDIYEVNERPRPPPQNELRDSDQEEDKSARKLMTEIGFDPEDITTEGKVVAHHAEYGSYRMSSTPIIYFSAMGNLKMCRYLLYSRGADCSKPDTDGRFPLLAAAFHGHLDVVQWLCHVCGVKEDIRKQSTFGWSPLGIALHNMHEDIVKWMLPNGAFSSQDEEDGVIDDAILRNNLRPVRSFPWFDDKRLIVLSWAQDAVAIHATFQLFLKGSILPASSFRRHPSNYYATRSKRIKVSSSTKTTSPLVIFNGKSGILELISEYTGIPKPKELRIFRQLMDLLPAFIEDVPFAPFAPFEEEENEDY